MRLGETWRGADGTEYRVVMPQDVKPDQPRWWIDTPPEPGDRMLGPAEPSRLHLVPARKCGGPELQFALVK